MSLLPPLSLDCGTPIPLRRQYCSHGDARERGRRAPGARLHIKHYGHCSGRGYSAHMTHMVSCSQNRQLDVRPKSTLPKSKNGSLQNLAWWQPPSFCHSVMMLDRYRADLLRGFCALQLSTFSSNLTALLR
jgi:hypothetical protein